MSNLYIYLWFKIDGFEVWVVNENLVKTDIDPDYTEAGQPLACWFVPPGEIWIGDEVKNKEAVFIHEWTEYHDMLENGTPYDTAHDRANQVEMLVRRAMADDTI